MTRANKILEAGKGRSNWISKKWRDLEDEPLPDTRDIDTYYRYDQDQGLSFQGVDPEYFSVSEIPQGPEGSYYPAEPKYNNRRGPLDREEEIEDIPKEKPATALELEKIGRWFKKAKTKKPPTKAAVSANTREIRSLTSWYKNTVDNESDPQARKLIRAKYLRGLKALTGVREGRAKNMLGYGWRDQQLLFDSVEDAWKNGHRDVSDIFNIVYPMLKREGLELSEEGIRFAVQHIMNK